jgi:RND family efflux transporter MFP subunit
VDLNQLKIERAQPAGGTWKRKRGLPIGWIVTLALLALCAYVFWGPLLRGIDDIRLPKVSTAKAVRSNPLAASVVSGTAANGYIVAAKRAALSADTPGRIVELNVVEGSVVKKGQVVARLYSDEVRASLQRTEADMLAAQASIERARAQRDAASNDLERLQADVARAEAGLLDPQLARQWFELELARWQRLAEQDIQNKRTAEEAASQVERAKAAVTNAEAAVTQARAALAQGESQVLALDAAVVETQARVGVVEADRAQALATLDKLEVRAPFDGVVVLKDAEVGEVVSPNSQGGNSRGSVATMVDWASLEVQVELPQTSLAAVQKGQLTNIYLDAFPERLYRGTLTRIWPTANRQKGTVELRIRFDEPDEFLRPEMGVRVVFPDKEMAPAAEAEEKVLIPTDCVVRQNGRPGVFIVERERVRWLDVGLGDERSGRVVVISGLIGGEVLVRLPPAELKDGDRVRIAEGS